MNIQRAAEESGFDAGTIRFYERKGVLPRPPRRENGYREYTAEHLSTLQLVKGLRHLGMSLSDMRMIAQVSHDGTCGDLRSTLIHRLDGVLAETAQRARELQHTSEHIGKLLSGLRRMRARDQQVPGASPCRCVELVGGEDEAVVGERSASGG